jgi:triosephosphate isomerase
MARKLVVGNWKMHGSLAGNPALLSAVVAGATGLTSELAVCVPTAYLAQIQQLLLGSPLTWGAQDCSAHPQGAYTGETSAAMLGDFGCRWVIVGHSERRHYHGESDGLVAQKMLQVLASGANPIACVGETLAERDNGQAQAVVQRQVAALIGALKEADQMQWIWRVVIAYEPVWAIGTGKTASADDAQRMHAAIRQQWIAAFAEQSQQLRVLYGGSVKPANAAELFAQADVDGGLIGGAALKADDFLAIARAAG